MKENELRVVAKTYMNEHKKAFEEWEDGDIEAVWRDIQGTVCIKYESGKWWHYKVNDAGVLEWW